jgi:FixJ family two-component response regulator
LITDVQMPGINGIELLGRLKANGYTFPVIVITAFPDGRVRDRVLQLGACCLLTKPFGGAVLADWVDKAINRQ